MKNATLFLPILALILIIALLIFINRKPQTSAQMETENAPSTTLTPEAEDSAEKPETAEVTATTLEPLRKRPIPPSLRKMQSTTVATRAPDFPYEIKKFTDWPSLSKEEIEKYRESFISRIGRWSAEEIQSLFYNFHDSIQPDAKPAFREIILGLWCAKDVEGCLQSLEQEWDQNLAHIAKQDALTGWVAEDWISGLNFLKRNGDEAIEARLGGDSTGFVAGLAHWVAAEASEERRKDFLASLSIPRHKAFAEQTLAEKQ